MTKVPSSVDLTKKPAFDYWYYYQCTPSSETRGRRKAHEGGCGHFIPRGTKQPISETWKPQGNRCPNCGRRQRLNPGIVVQPREFEYVLERDLPILAIEKKAWVHAKCAELNSERLSEDSNADGVSKHKNSVLKRNKWMIERKRADLRAKMLAIEAELRGDLNDSE